MISVAHSFLHESLSMANATQNYIVLLYAAVGQRD